MIEIRIPFSTPSINHMYGLRGFRKFIKPEGKTLREAILLLIKALDLDINSVKDKKLSVEVDIFEKWMTKKDTVARKDISNREKFLVDSVFMALEIDDKFIWEHTMTKVQSNDEYFIIRIKEYF